MSNFDKSFFVGNRAKLAKKLPGHLLCISAHAMVQYSADLHYPFRQDSNFWYLCGINEPDAILLIDTDTGVSTLLLQKKNSYQNEWDGESNETEYKKISGVNKIGFKSDLAQIIKKAVSNNKKIGYLAPSKNRIEPFGFYANPARKLLAAKLQRYTEDVELHDVRLDIARLRQVKQPIEIEAIKSAIRATATTLASVKSRLGSFKTEKDVERAITAGFYANGGDGHSFEPIVAKGKNAAILHYVNNKDALTKNSFLLIDVGIKMNGYTSDVSRIWSLGTVSDRQKEIYKAVLSLQEEFIADLKPGVKLAEFNKNVQQRVIEVMKAHGVTDAENRPQGFGHYLGIDTHDSADYYEPLKPGVVLTVEPGIYLTDEGIGVRIEDDILITENGSENLSSMIPKLL